jgi:hypothetical protein
MLPSSKITKRKSPRPTVFRGPIQNKVLGSSTKKIFHPLNNRAGLIHKLFDQNLEILAARGIDVQD